jgi:hypothetical protein
LLPSADWDSASSISASPKESKLSGFAFTRILIRRMLDEEGLGPVSGHKRHSESRPGKVRNAGKKQILGL